MTNREMFHFIIEGLIRISPFLPSIINFSHAISLQRDTLFGHLVSEETRRLLSM